MILTRSPAGLVATVEMLSVAMTDNPMRNFPGVAPPTLPCSPPIRKNTYKGSWEKYFKLHRHRVKDWNIPSQNSHESWKNFHLIQTSSYLRTLTPPLDVTIPFLPPWNDNRGNRTEIFIIMDIKDTEPIVGLFNRVRKCMELDEVLYLWDQENSQ